VHGLGRRAMETSCAARDNLPWIFIRKPPRMTTKPKDPRSSLDEIAASIKKLIQYLETKEVEGRRLTATEVDAIALKLQIHVEELLAASKNLGDH
jgi:hypothetical protein